MLDSNYTMTLIANSTSASKTSVQWDAPPYFEEYMLVLKVICPCWIVIILFGVITNVLSIIVFLKARVTDSVSVLLLSLAMSDLAFLILITPRASAIIMVVVVPSYKISFDPDILTNLLYWPAYTVYDISTFISVSLGVMRCACVAMPLKFKVVFTRSRTVKWVMFLVVLAVALRFPVLTVMRLAWKVDPATNTSVVYLKQVNRESMSRINDMMNRGFVIYFNYVTMVSCVIILTIKLYQASKIRRSCTATSSTDQLTTKTEDKGLSSKDLQVVKSVVLICTIFILSQLMFLVYSSIRLFDTNFDDGTNLQFLFGIFSQISGTCAFLNASLNIFVHFNFNTKYRSDLLSLFCKGKQ